jgi:hypothetical protein
VLGAGDYALAVGVSAHDGDVCAYEQRILQDNPVYRYSGPDVLVGNGNDELFTRDVLGLDPGEDRQLKAGTLAGLE